MDKLDLILEKLEKIDALESKIDKIQSDITVLKTNNKLINSKLDSLTEITYTIKIEKIENKAV